MRAAPSDLSPDDRSQITRLSNCLAILEASANASKVAMTVPLVQTFLIVALNEGKSTTDMAREMGIPLATIHRRLMDLGDIDRRREQGLQLVETIRNPQDRRLVGSYLTTRGRKVLRDVLRAQRGTRGATE